MALSLSLNSLLDSFIYLLPILDQSILSSFHNSDLQKNIYEQLRHFFRKTILYCLNNKNCLKHIFLFIFIRV